MLAVQSEQFVIKLLSLTDEKDINKIAQRLGVVGTGAAGAHDVFKSLAVLCKNGNAAQLEHIQQVGIAQLVRQGESDNIEVAKRSMTLKRVELYIVLAHLLFHILPRCEDTLAPSPLKRVYGGVEYLHTDMGHTYLIAVRKAKSKAHIDLVRILDNTSLLSADITSRLLHLQQNIFKHFNTSDSSNLYNSNIKSKL